MGKSIGTPEQKRLLKLLRQVRIDAGLRQVDLAERLGQPQSFVSKYELGERRLDLLELQKICDAVGISLAKFVMMFEQATLSYGKQKS
ncbi:MAG: helix-turn-helix domain-containing protein [Acidobacteriota bacterium]|nr:helix-turn-helix domain-containing protein [Acidobacteriota bacterium]